MILVDTVQFIRTVKNYVEYWTPNEVNPGVRSETFEVFQHHEMKMNRENTRILYSEEHGLYYVSVSNEWLQKYITSAMGIFHD